MGNTVPQRIIHDKQLVLTSEQLAEFYGTDLNHIRVNFSRNRDRYIVGKHYFLLEGEALRQFKDSITESNLVDKRAPSLYLWTQKGALLHAKSLNTDRAWEMYDWLVDEYFRLIREKEESPYPLLNSLFVDRLRLFSRHTKIPRDRWCVFQEICQPFLEFELRGYQLPDKAVPDGSVGRRWCDYARDVLGYDMSLVESYPHVYPDKRGKQPASIYPLEWLPAFRLWFYTVYLPENFPQYLRYLKASMSEIDLVLKGFGLPPQLKPGK